MWKKSDRPSPNANPGFSVFPLKLRTSRERPPLDKAVGPARGKGRDADGAPGTIRDGPDVCGRVAPADSSALIPESPKIARPPAAVRAISRRVPLDKTPPAIDLCGTSDQGVLLGNGGRGDGGMASQTGRATPDQRVIGRGATAPAGPQFGTPNGLTRLIQCAPMARNTSGGRFHPDSSRFDLVADERLCRVTGRAEAS
jgi:hypothetical protein